MDEYKLKYTGKEIDDALTRAMQVKTPVKGVDYFTAADKAELVTRVIAALPDASEVSY
jgi:hypothetical protein